eukprot:m.211138 g.211138  ORF g.211138 m.211138 type:complete len:343 (-) comp17868_c0_seq1:329-1357(-)
MEHQDEDFEMVDSAESPSNTANTTTTNTESSSNTAVAAETVQEAKKTVAETAETVKKAAQETTETVKKAAQETAEPVKKAAQEATQEAKKTVSQAAAKVEQAVTKTTKQAAAKAKEAAATGEPLFPQLLCLRDSLPHHVGGLIYYDHPICSGAVLFTLLGAHWLLTCKCGFSLLWLVSTVLMWALLGLVVLTAGNHAFQRYVRKNQNPDNIVTSVIAPRLSACCCPAGVCLSKGTMQQHVGNVWEIVAKGGDCLKRAFLCEDLAHSLKTIAMLFALKIVGALFSGPSLILLVLLLAFSVPAVYSKFHTRIDAKLAPIVEKAHASLSQLISQLRAKIARPKAE